MTTLGETEEHRKEEGGPLEPGRAQGADSIFMQATARRRESVPPLAQTTTNQGGYYVYAGPNCTIPLFS
ncbi:hypothetical protein EYF80_036827 [Liparis tanakae]|uniref:Uncharacterized protein n=1 Tax=Liparis tanakae TaxID=230148 RepID=A0A4Z2GJP5_9TELE|nr:hypothetical protein EYF80_036827 [Liparis tanakae]